MTEEPSFEKLTEEQEKKIEPEKKEENLLIKEPSTKEKFVTEFTKFWYFSPIIDFKNVDKFLDMIIPVIVLVLPIGFVALGLWSKGFDFATPSINSTFKVQTYHLSSSALNTSIGFFQSTLISLFFAILARIFPRQYKFPFTRGNTTIKESLALVSLTVFMFGLILLGSLLSIKV